MDKCAAFTPIASVSTNIKLGASRPETITLGSRVTVLSGPIGCGKTRWCQALAWLLTGTMDDLGRANASTAGAEIDLTRPEGASSVWAMVDGEAGRMSADLSVNPKTGRAAAKPVVKGGAAHPMAFPVREVARWLQKDPKETWTCFLPHVAWGTRGEAIAAQVGSVALETVQHATRIRLLMPTSLDALIAMRERASTEASTTNKEIAAIEGQVAGMRQVLGLVVTSTEIAELEVRTQRMMAAILEAERALGVPELRAKLLELRDTIRRGEEAIAQRYPDPGPMPRAASFVALIDEGASLRTRAQAAGMTVCPVSGIAWEHTKVDGLNRVASNLRASTKDWSEKKDVHTRAVAKLQTLKAEADRIDGALQATQTAQATTPEKLVMWKEAHSQALNKLASMKQSRDAYERIQQGEEQIRTFKLVKSAWEDLYTACANAVEGLTRANIERFTALVQEGVPKRFEVRIDTEIDGRSVFRPWLHDREGTSGRTSSGGQRAMLLLALTRAVLLTSQNLPPYVVMALPEERSFDGDSLGDLCRTLAKLDGPQIILTNIDAPTGTLPPTVKLYHFDATGAEVAPRKGGRKRKAQTAEVEVEVEVEVEPVAEPVAADPVAELVDARVAEDVDLWGAPEGDPAIPTATAPAPEAPAADDLDALFGAPLEDTHIAAPTDDTAGAPFMATAKDDDGPEEWDEVGEGEPEAGWTPPDTTPGALVMTMPDANGADPFTVGAEQPQEAKVEAQEPPSPKVTQPKVEPVGEAKDIEALNAAIGDALAAIFGT